MNAQKRLATNPIYHAIAQAITEEITTNHPNITTTLDTIRHENTHYPSLILEIDIPNKYLFIGHINIDQHGLHFIHKSDIHHIHQNHSLYDSHEHITTTIELEDPNMHTKIHHNIHQMINHAKQLQFINNTTLTPAQLAGK